MKQKKVIILDKEYLDKFEEVKEIYNMKEGKLLETMIDSLYFSKQSRKYREAQDI